MDQAERRRARLAQLLDLAQNYKGWTRKELAASLGRDPTKLIPGSGVPKLDLVVDLANVLDWPVGDVVELLWIDGEVPVRNGAATELAFDELDTESRAAHRAGRYADLISLGRRMERQAECPDQLALACNRQAGGWDGLGRFTKVLSCVQRGLAEGPLPPARRAMLEANLSNAHYTLWHLVEARSTANDLIERFDAEPPAERTTEVVHAFAHYVRGNAHRRMLDVDPGDVKRLAGRAHADLERARTMYLALAEKYDDDSYRGIANTCAGAMIEVEAALGRSEPLGAMERISSGLDAAVDLDTIESGDWIESWGWWCIFGCNIALRHVRNERTLQQYMAVFTNKAQEIADHLDNWAMRERVFTMEYARRQRFHEWTGLPSEWTIDQDDVRVVTGTMGRFPEFRRTGWTILQTAKVVR
jgi:hypothetical protein